MKSYYHLRDAQSGHQVIQTLWQAVKPQLIAGHRLEVVVQPESRSLDQNAVQWPYLEAFSRQLVWPVNGELVKMEPEEWKDVLTAAFKGETARLAHGLNGGVVMLGLRTSRMSKKVFSEWLDFLKATAALRGVEVEDYETAE